MRDDKSSAQEKMLAESLSDAFGEGAPLPFRMARHVRRRRAAKRVIGAAAVTAAVAIVASFGWRVHVSVPDADTAGRRPSVSRIAAERAVESTTPSLPTSSSSIDPSLVASPNLGYEIATDEDLHRFLAGKPVMIIAQSTTSQRVVWLEKKKDAAPN